MQTDKATIQRRAVELRAIADAARERFDALCEEVEAAGADAAVADMVARKAEEEAAAS